jgi:PIN domain nuclease of toxin-antitoxin system
MRLLLDTRVFIWSVIHSRQLKAATRRYLASAEIVYVSAASIWEIAIKNRLGNMTGDAEAFAAAIDASGFQELPVTGKHAAAVARLPLHHADPFDCSGVPRTIASGDGGQSAGCLRRCSRVHLTQCLDGTRRNLMPQLHTYKQVLEQSCIDRAGRSGASVLAAHS